MSRRAEKVYATRDQLPMQFGLNGAVGWSAPRRWALSFSPILAMVIMVPTAFAEPGAGVMVFVGACMIGGHALHLWLIERTFRKDGS